MKDFFEEYNKVEPLNYPLQTKYNKYIISIANFQKVKNQMLEGMHAPLFNPYNVHHGIYGNEGQKQSYYNKAAELEYQPQPVTSDASLQLAGNLDRKLNADKYRL